MNSHALNEVSNMTMPNQIGKSGAKTPVPKELSSQQLNFNAMIPPKGFKPKEQTKQ
jgi:hypothetical protein